MERIMSVNYLSSDLYNNGTYENASCYENSPNTDMTPLLNWPKYPLKEQTTHTGMVEAAKKVFKIAKDINLKFPLSVDNDILNYSIPREQLTYEDRTSYLKHAQLLLLRVLDNYPQLNHNAFLPGLRLIALTISIKHAAEFTVYNIDIIKTLPSSSLDCKAFNLMEIYFLKLIDSNLNTGTINKMEEEIKTLAGKILYTQTT